MIAELLAAPRHGVSAAWRDRRVRELVAHAYARVPYYRRLFDSHGVRPERIRGIADLTLIPTSTRRDLAAAAPEELIASGVDAGRLIGLRTSGSSGMPFTSRRTWLEHRRLHTIRARAMLAAGLRLGDRVARVCCVGPGDPRDRRVFGQLLHAAGLMRQHKVDTFLPPNEIAARLAALGPDVVVGTPGVLALVADAARCGTVLPRLVLTGSEVLTPDMRERIVQGFGAEVIDVYGSSEMTLIAWECATTGAMHVCEEAVALEVLRTDDTPAATGETGEVVCTNLHAFAMPLIRYRQGDVVTQGEARCRCGRAAATVTGVVGRTLDLFPLPDGRLLHPYELVACFKTDLAGWVSQYELVQQAPDLVVLRLVPRGAAPHERAAAIRAEAARVLGNGVQFDVVIVDELRLERSGKRRVCRSYVRSQYDEAGAER